ncbi:MAG: ComEC/Rec2 family competence protein, partial [Burkholderiales bacterium]
MRQQARTRIQAALPEAPYAGVIAALAIGDQRAIPPEQWQTFTRTGVNHLMSISGLHVTMVSGLVFALVGGLWRRTPWLTLALPAPKAAVLAGFGAALLYALLAGYAVPAQRTVYMLAVVAVALWAGVIESASVVLCAALLVVVLSDPWAVLAPGFWLSFGAVAVILHVTTGRIEREHWLAIWTRVQVAVTLALIPLLLALFQQVSIVSPLANAVAIPVVSLVVAPLALIGSALPFDFILQCAHLVMSGCMFVLEWMSELPDAVWQQHAPPGWTVAVAVAALALLLAPRGLPGRWLGVAGLLPLFTVMPAALRAGDAEVVVLDVGQGLSALVRTERHALLFDTGPQFGPGADSGSRIIVPY